MCRIHGLIPEILRGVRSEWFVTTQTSNRCLISSVVCASAHQRWSITGTDHDHRCGIIKAEIEVRTVGGAVYVFGNELCLLL